MPIPFLRCCLLSAALALLLALAGCTTKGAGPKSGSYVVTALTAEFFKYGPAQSFGPDFTLKKGDRVNMLEHTWGFSKVMTENGVSGYIASEEIEPAPPSATPRLAANTTRAGKYPIGSPRPSLPSWQKRNGGEVIGNPNDPLFNVDDVPMPMPDDTPAKARPQFRATPPGGQPAPAEKAKPKFRG